MTATLQPNVVADLARVIGRTEFTQSLFLSPKRDSVSLALRVTADPRLWIVQNLKMQPVGQRAIIFCLFKKNVQQMADFLRSKMPGRDVYECWSGSIDKVPLFKASVAGIMVCTSVLTTGVSIDAVTSVYFLDGVSGAETCVQGAGRGARAEGERCIATLVTSKSQLEFFMTSENFKSTAVMADFCHRCDENKADFAEEIYKLFEHPPQKGTIRKVCLQLGVYVGVTVLCHTHFSGI